MRRLAVLALLAASATLAACGPAEGVVRVVDGRTVSGAFVPAEAYAAYLRAAVADEGGDLDGAVEGYAIAATLGPADPEPWARLGDARCRRDAHDPRALDAIERALAIDAWYTPALEAKGACAERRGDRRTALDAARRAARGDPRAVAPLASLAHLEEGDGSEASRQAGSAAGVRGRLLAMTLVAATDAAAWRALATWARGHGDPWLEARALGKAAALAPSRSAEIDAAAVRLAGEGEAIAARSLARARLEVEGGAPIDPRVARWAIDAALLDGDVPGAERVATRARVPLTVVAARALLLGDARAAREIAAMVVAADPRGLAGRLVLAAAADAQGDEGTLAHVLAVRGRDDAPLPAEVWLAYGRTLARSASPASAMAVRALFDAVGREPILSGDSLATPVAVALAAEGALDAAELDADGLIELAERRAEAPPATALARADARHRLLGLARTAPRDGETLTLARRLAPARAHDAVVAVALARLSLAGAADPRVMGEALARLDPADPLVAAAALDCALRAGDARAIPAARARLAALAGTPAERARVE